MKKAVMEKWVTSLRSDQYRQVRGALRNDQGHCCLGVLCDVYHKETGKGYWDGLFFKFDETSCNTGELPPFVMDWCGMKTSSGYLPKCAHISEEVQSLVGMNDEGTNFDQIAEVIEAKWRSL